MIRTLKNELFAANLKRMLLLKLAIQQQGLVVPLNADRAIEHADAAIAAGATVLEVYLRAMSEATWERDISEALTAIRAIKGKHPDVFIGAGSADQPWLAALAIRKGADFIISQGFVQDTVKQCANDGVLCILGADDCVSISQYVQVMDEQYRFYLSDDELAQLGMTRLQAEKHLVKFFNATGRITEFGGMATTYHGKRIGFLIAGGVTCGAPTYHSNYSTVTTDQSVASWSSRANVCAVTSSAMMTGDVQAGVRAALAQVQFGRQNPPARKS